MDLELFTFALYLMMAVGMYKLARKQLSGWILYCMANVGWIAVGIEIGLTSMVLWSILYTVISGAAVYREVINEQDN